MNDGRFPIRLGIQRLRPAVHPGPLLQVLTPPDGQCPLQPQNQGPASRRSIMPPSASLASGHRRPWRHRTLARNMHKSGSTDGSRVAGWGSGLQRKAVTERMEKKRTRPRLSSLDSSEEGLSQPRPGHSAQAPSLGALNLSSQKPGHPHRWGLPGSLFSEAGESLKIV